MERERFRRFVLLVEGTHKAVQKIKFNRAPDFGVKGVHTLWVYELLLHPEGITASELAAQSMIDRSLISRELEPLKELGYIETDGDPSKRNYNAKIKLTEKGKEVASNIGKIALEVQTLADNGISEEELDSFYKTLEKINKNLLNIAEENKI
jgi:DNA-binding MarR family transcriptional regulator